MPTKGVRYFLSVLFVLTLSAVANTAAAASDYVLGAGDVVRIKVYQFQDLETRTRVSEKGTITFPLLGEVMIGGLSERASEVEIARRLKKARAIRDPQVTVMVEEYRSRMVSVLGSVSQPGQYIAEPDKTVVDMISKAGGLTSEASNSIVVTKPGSTDSKRTIDLTAVLERGDFSQNTLVNPGDVIFVPTAAKVFVYGEVNRPGAYRLEPGMSVVQAISVAGGLSPRGTSRGLKVMRPSGEGDESGDLMAVDLTDRLKANDVLYVKESLF